MYICMRAKVSGGQDKLVRVWNAETLLHIKNFKGHRSTVTVSGIVILLCTNILGTGVSISTRYL